MLSGFKAFILRGNVIDLAVGVIIGGAFGAIVASLTADIITPLIGTLIGKPDFSAIKAGEVMVGKFLNAVVSFLLTAAGLYFLIVLPFNKLMEMSAKPAAPPPPPGPTPTEALLTEIRDLLKK